MAENSAENLNVPPATLLVALRTLHSEGVYTTSVSNVLLLVLGWSSAIALVIQLLAIFDEISREVVTSLDLISFQLTVVATAVCFGLAQVRADNRRQLSAICLIGSGILSANEADRALSSGP